jgi:hypothetical protein
MLDTGAPVEEVNKLFAISFQKAFPQSKIFQSLSEKVNSNLILLPNSPTTASDMLNSTITSFAASHQLGEQLKLKNPMPKLEEKVILKE